METLLVTPLNAWHKAHGAKMVPFAGWEMPVQYSGIIAEHGHCRTRAAIFDICHMGEFSLKGPGAKNALAAAVTQNLDTLAPGKCRYGFLLNEQGGVLDDLIVYRIADEEFMLVVNGACTASDFATIKGRLPAGLAFADISDNTAKIDLQGPKSFEVLARVLPGEWNTLGYFSFRKTAFDGAEIIVSRTGYTGELGYEFYLPADKAQALWEKLAADPEVLPAGLGARDTLRLEMGYPLYGQDLDTEHTPAEAGYDGMLGSAAPFTGKARAFDVRRKLVALSIEGRRSARHHDKVLDGNGKEVGVVTSGSFSPTLGHSIALAYLDAQAAEADGFTVQAAKAQLPAKKVDLPFYKGGTARAKLS
ncbi:Aminomethyltransferase [Fundidesulfovibrio magnetotacticus]|uniref:aminomethyltransferase n=1 Tax=Fundidesulfovibrio magnetotacticus TaxID=2730080 RepID=A0A6V8LW97_9BACT|nr:glycine cleavage system aminomethyltransferase GcvT [Fundidesulfovibrio magnetotacticus]GFK94339.1 Aminomethyltransferase [Fundidesulfovibrio magnetotacticus]